MTKTPTQFIAPSKKIIRSETRMQDLFYDIHNEMNLGHLISELEKLENLHGKNARIGMDGEDYEGPNTFVLILEREETDEEYELRVSKLRASYLKRAKNLSDTIKQREKDLDALKVEANKIGLTI